MQFRVKFRSHADVSSRSSLTANRKRLSCSPPFEVPNPRYNAFQPANCSRKENINVTSTLSPELDQNLSSQKSSPITRGTSIPIPQVQDQEVHRVVLDQPRPHPRQNKEWMGTFPRSLIPLSKSPERKQSHLPLPVSPSSTKSIRLQLPRLPSRPNLSTVFDQEHRALGHQLPTKSTSPPSIKCGAPILRTQLRAQERLRLQGITMGKNKRNRGKKAQVAESANEDDIAIEFGGLVQQGDTVMESIDAPTINPSIESTDPLEPPEMFVPNDTASVISSPKDFFSAFGSPVSNSTSSQIFDYASTGLDWLPTSKINEEPLGSFPALLKKNTIPVDQLAADASRQAVFLSRDPPHNAQTNGATDGSPNRRPPRNTPVITVQEVSDRLNSPGDRGQFQHDSAAHDDGTYAPENTPLGAGETAYRGASPGRDSNGTCQAEGTVDKPRKRDDDKDDGAPGPSCSGSGSTLAPPRASSGRFVSNSTTTRTSHSSSVQTRNLAYNLNSYTGIGDIKYAKPNKDLNPSSAFDRRPPSPLLRLEEDANHFIRSSTASPAEDSDEDDMATIVPDDHTNDDAVKDFGGDDTELAPTPGMDDTTEPPKAKKKKKPTKKKNKKAQPGRDATATITDDMADFQLDSGPRPKNVRQLLKKDTPAVLGEPPPTKDGSIAFFDPANRVFWRPGCYLNDRDPKAIFFIDGDTVKQITGTRVELDYQAPSAPAPAMSDKAKGKRKAFTGLNPEASIFRPGPAKTATETGPAEATTDTGSLAPAEFLSTHPTAKPFSTAAEAYIRPSHAMLGSPILRIGDNNSTAGFSQGRKIPGEISWNPNIPEVDSESDRPVNMYNYVMARYALTHGLFDLKDSAWDNKTFTHEGVELEAHNKPCGTFVTTKDGVLVAPPGNSALFTRKLSPMLKKSPKAFGVGDSSKFIGIPMASLIPVHQPVIHVLGHDSNPYYLSDGTWVELMPEIESPINENFLTGLEKITDLYNKRMDLGGDSKYMEPNINMGYSKRAEHCQGIQISGDASNPADSALDTPVTVIHPKTGKPVQGTKIKPGLRGGGDASIPSYIMTTFNLDPKADSPNTIDQTDPWGRTGYSYLNGTVLSNPQDDIFKHPPFAILTDGNMEVIFSDCNLRRIANNTTSKGAKVIQLCGGYYGPQASSANWPSTPRYTCSWCGSVDHGRKHCPVNFIKGGKENCMHCGRDGHLLAACPYPIQNLPARTMIQSLILYVGTLHCRMAILTWEFEHGLITEEKFIRLRSEMTKNPLQGEAMHAFATIPACPNCDDIHHQGLWRNLLDQMADRFRERGNVEEWQLKPNQWLFDNRRCPLYTVFYNRNFKSYEFLAYNPSNHLALDALYRDFLRAQGWHIKTAMPVADDHLVTMEKGRPTRLPDVKTATAILAGEQEYPADWVRQSGENDFFCWW